MIETICQRIAEATTAKEVWDVALKGLEALAEKSVAGVVRKFKANLRNVMTLGFISDKSILADLRRVVREGVTDAYTEGLREGGADPNDLADEDAQAIADLVNTQAQHTTDLAKAIRQAKSDKALQRDLLNVRLPLWVASIESAGNLGRASAQVNIMGTWKLGKTEEHCETCAKLNGKRHRLRWYIDNGLIPRQPGNENLQCGGWKCDCQVVDDKGRRLL